MVQTIAWQELVSSRFTIVPLSHKLATEPPEITTFRFYNISPDILVYVPAEALEVYQKAEVWNEFNLQGLP